MFVERRKTRVHKQSVYHQTLWWQRLKTYNSDNNEIKESSDDNNDDDDDRTNSNKNDILFNKPMYIFPWGLWQTNHHIEWYRYIFLHTKYTYLFQHDSVQLLFPGTQQTASPLPCLV